MNTEKLGFFRKWDGYAQPVQFTYKGESEFTTTTGGCITILTSLLIFLYGVQQVIYLFIRPDYSATTTVTYKDFT